MDVLGRIDGRSDVSLVPVRSITQSFVSFIRNVRKECPSKNQRNENIKTKEREQVLTALSKERHKDREREKEI